MCEPTTCGPFYVSDWRRLQEEMVTVLKAQGYRITKNAIASVERNEFWPLPKADMGELINKSLS